VNELQCNFAEELPAGLRALKLQITHAWYSMPCIKEETAICDTIEQRVLRSQCPPNILWVNLHDEVMAEHGRAERLTSVAAVAHIDFRLSTWEEDEMRWM